MDVIAAADGRVAVLLQQDELVMLRHCIVEAMEALREDDFLKRTGLSKRTAESALASLEDAGRLLGEGG